MKVLLITFFFLKIIFINFNNFSTPLSYADTPIHKEVQISNITEQKLLYIAAILCSINHILYEKDTEVKQLITRVKNTIHNDDLYKCNDMKNYVLSLIYLLDGERDKAISKLYELSASRTFSELPSVYYILALQAFQNKQLHEAETLLSKSVETSNQLSKKPLTPAILSLIIIRYQTHKLTQEEFKKEWEQETKYSYLEEFIDFEQLVHLIEHEGELLEYIDNINSHKISDKEKQTLIYTLMFFGVLLNENMLPLDWQLELAKYSNEGYSTATSLLDYAMTQESVSIEILIRLLHSDTISSQRQNNLSL